jgi:uncharacterized membrane protein YhaH (DUF805 family)
MNDNIHNAAGAIFGVGLVLFIICFALAFYVLACFCYKRICEKCGKAPGAIIWIPFVHFIPLLEIVKMPVWTIILVFIPIVNFFWLIVLFAKLCVARGKSGWLVILLFIPVVNLIFLPYLAFSE